MAIKKVKLPNNTTEDINDPRLPVVTTTDDGKVLSVSGGIWSADSKPSYTLDEVADGSTRKLSDYQPVDADLTAIAGLSGTSGLLKKTAANTWSLDTNTYYYSGNANKRDVSWDCYVLTATSSILSDSASNGTFIRFDNTNYSGYRYLGPHSTYSYDLSWHNGSGWQKVYHSGNSNKSDVAWACSTLSTNGASTFSGGHLYLTGANASSSTANTTQIVFGTSSTNHVVLSSNPKKLVINPSTSSITGQTSIGVDGEDTYFSSSGNFGIGTNSPSNKFHVVGASRFDIPSFTDFKIKRTSNSGSAGITFYPSNQTTNYWVSGADPNSSTASVAYRYFWYYKNTYTGYLTTGGNMVITGTYTPGSDTRIKDKQEVISKEQAFSVLEDLKPKTWIWNEKAGEDKHGKTCAGLVAQEVEEILPDAVVISECGAFKDFHSLNYNMVQGYEIAAIKGLIEEVKSLKAEIAELKKQIK